MDVARPQIVHAFASRSCGTQKADVYLQWIADVRDGVEKSACIVTAPRLKDVESGIRIKGQDDFEVHFEHEDRSNPQNFSAVHKAWITVQLGALTLTGSLGTSMITPAETAIAKHFKISQEVAVIQHCVVKGAGW